MPATQFNCPLCENLFQVEPENLGLQVSCPHCQGLVQIPPAAANGAPPIQQEPPPTQPPPTHVDAPTEADPSGEPAGEGPPIQEPLHQVAHKSHEMTPAERRSARERRRFVRNATLWFFCAAVLLGALWALLSGKD